MTNGISGDILYLGISMASKQEIKVNPNTMKQISEILDENPEGQKLIKEALVGAIEKLWGSICQPKTTLLFVETNEFNIKPKPEYCDLVKSMTGSDGPYTAIKTCKSWVGLSDGVYQIKDTNSLIPVSWFVAPKSRKFYLSSLWPIALLLFSVIQSIIILLLIIAL